MELTNRKDFIAMIKSLREQLQASKTKAKRYADVNNKCLNIIQDYRELLAIEERNRWLHFFLGILLGTALTIFISAMVLL